MSLHKQHDYPAHFLRQKYNSGRHEGDGCEIQMSFSFHLLRSSKVSRVGEKLCEFDFPRHQAK